MRAVIFAVGLTRGIAGIARRVTFGLQGGTEGNIAGGLLGDLGIAGSLLGGLAGNARQPGSLAIGNTRIAGDVDCFICDPSLASRTLAYPLCGRTTGLELERADRSLSRRETEVRFAADSPLEEEDSNPRPFARNPGGSPSFKGGWWQPQFVEPASQPVSARRNPSARIGRSQVATRLSRQGQSSKEANLR